MSTIIAAINRHRFTSLMWAIAILSTVWALLTQPFTEWVTNLAEAYFYYYLTLGGIAFVRWVLIYRDAKHTDKENAESRRRIDAAMAYLHQKGHFPN